MNSGGYHHQPLIGLVSDVVMATTVLCFGPLTQHWLCFDFHAERMRLLLALERTLAGSMKRCDWASEVLDKNEANKATIQHCFKTYKCWVYSHSFLSLIC